MVKSIVKKFDLTKKPTKLTQLLENDCGRTAVAMVLGLESVEEIPFFEENQWENEDKWLRERGVQCVHIPIPGSWDVESYLENWLHGCPAILQGTSQGGHEHVVAVIDNRLVDTVDYSGKKPLSGPSKDSFYWLTLLVPVRK